MEATRGNGYAPVWGSLVMMMMMMMMRQVRMYYRSGTVDKSSSGQLHGGRCCISVGWMLRVHSPDVSTFLREMTSWSPSDAIA